MHAPIPNDEQARLDSLHSLRILDTPPEPAFDTLVELASRVCEAEIALISLVDSERQWFKAKFGLSAVETHRDLAFCAHAILHPGEILEVPDAALDPRFAVNPLVTGEPKIRFYAGIPIAAGDGHSLGTLCVIDRFPRRLHPEQARALRALGLQASGQLEVKRQLRMLSELSVERCRSELLLSAGRTLISSISEGASFDKALAAYLSAVGRISPELENALAAGLDRSSLRGSLALRTGEPSRAPLIQAAVFALDNAAALASGQRALRQQEQKLSALVESLSEVVFQIDCGGRWTFLNPAWFRVTGFAVGETLGKPFTERLDSRYAALAEKLFEALCSKPRRALRRKIEARTASGQILWLEVYAQAIEKDGAVTGVTGTLKDITRREEVEQERYWRARQAEMRAEISFTPNQYAPNHSGPNREETREALLERYASTAQRLLGIDAVQIWLASGDGESLELAAAAGVPTGSCDRLKRGSDPIAAVWESGRSWCGGGEMDRKGAVVCPIRVGNECAGVVCACCGARSSEALLGPIEFLALKAGRNLDRLAAAAERRRRDGALRESEARFRNLADSTPVVIWATGPTGAGAWLNQEGLRIAGFGEERRAGWSWRRLLHREDVAVCVAKLRNGNRPGGTFQFEYRLKDAAGGYRWMLTSGKPYFTPDGVHAGFIGTAIDISPQKEAAQKQKLAVDAAEAANRAKSEFLATVSHEIRTPLNAILGLTEVVLEGRLEPKPREHLQMVHSSALSLLDIINDVLDFARIESGRMEREPVAFNPRETIEKAVKPLTWRGERRNLPVRLLIAPEVPAAVVGDPLALSQIVVNLVSNAVKFTPSGEVAIRVHCVPGSGGGAALVGAADRCNLEIAVSDTGIGIPRDKQVSIFEPFTQADSSTTRQYGGTGLGLAICARLAEVAGWSIRLESEPGQGSTFYVSAAFGIPVQPASNRSLIEAAGGGGAASRPRILVAEDNMFNRAVIGEMLARTGHDFTIVENGVEAVEAFRLEPFDIVLMDLHMPLMNGFEAARQIRELSADRSRGAGPDGTVKRVAVIAFTADASDPRAAERGAVFDATLVKPVQKRDLAEALKRFSSARRAGGGEGGNAVVRPGSAAAMPEPVLPRDKSVLDYEYGLRAAGGVRDQFLHLAQLFLKHTPELISWLDRAVQSNNAGEVALYAHSLRGSAAAIGALQLASFASRLTDAARETDWPGILELRDAVHSRWTEVRILLGEMTPISGAVQERCKVPQ